MLEGSLFNHYPERPENRAATNAYLILCSAHKTASSFLDIFNSTQSTQAATDNPTDEEQDLLRAMLIFASAGLDSMVKQLVSEALSCVIEQNEGAESLFKQFIERRLNRSETQDNRFLANILGDANPRKVLLDELVFSITSQSLQSVDQLLKTAAFFNIESRRICENPKSLRQVFQMRNQISHEMDVDPNQASGNRRPRTKEHMIEATSELFLVSKNFLKEVDSLLG
ncbi:MAG: HEPN domain-containing protein [Phormidesmis sp.]